MKKQLSIVLFLLSIMVMAQEGTPNKPFYRGKIPSVEYVSPIANRPSDVVPFVNVQKEAKDKRSMGGLVVAGKDPQTQDDFFIRNRNSKEQSVKMADAKLVFDTYSSNSQPTDPSLAVGPNHVMVVFNTGFMVYDKQGNELLGETAPNPAIFPSGGCCDLTVSYDNAADRWVLSFLGGGAQIAVSDGPNPLTSGWYIYNIPQINDYQKLSIWSDGYYITDNTNSSNRVWALERSAMLAGDTNAGILGFNLPNIATSGFYSPQVLNVTDNNLPAAGGATVVYMQDNAWSGVSNDHVKVWTIDVDWSNTSSSTVSSPQEISITPFIGVFDNGSFSNLPQPGGGATIDALQATIMNQAQFRKFATHNSAVFNFVVDVDSSSGKRAGVRWMEFRQSGDNQPWSLFQEGTYTAADGKHAWNASLAMDADGNIGMGYTSMSGPTTSSTVRVSSYFTGRSNGDPLGTMTAAETLIANGNANIPGTRYGDYSKVDVDPVDNSTFWYITEYMNNGRKGVVGTFEMAPAGPPDTENPTDPSNLTVSNISVVGATLSWTAATDNVGVANYLISINGNQVGTSSTTSFDVTGLSPLTTYTASVVAQDAAGNTSGSVSTTFTTLDGTIPVNYCDSSSNNVNDEFISNVTLNTINNDSGAQVYSDFTSISTNLNEGQQYTVSVTPTWTGTNYAEGYAVWIDYNNNGDFDDSGELVWSKAPSTDATNTGTFTVPSGTAQTAVRMRVSMKYNAIPTSCENFTYGEVEDYTINLETGTGGGGNPGVIAGYSFENGFEGWSDPGSDCARVNNAARSYDGSFSIRLRDDTNTSNTQSPVLDLSANNEVTFEFFAFINSFEANEDFFVEFFDGTSYQVIGQYVVGTNYNNDEFFTDTITLNAADYDFNANNRFRFRCDASGNADRVYFDQVTISGDNVANPFVKETTPTPGEQLKSFTENSLNNIKLYPNPAKNSLSIEILNGEFENVTIYSIAGQVVYSSDKKVVQKSTIDVSRFASGPYFVKFISNGKAVTKRFIKK
ncbi:T9SS type A sorting domain-containing protein [Tenacibaculum sp. M341]|uniref:T9SS type A sorting domain-containing protein n=1 Tax=Tenacibaculum sp. M341 TaxID=2530339 RepID=UPI0010454CC4|nr:GEVED domain-containing protein [Tenacibaculum sp. M341]TCI94801.1 T9SS type A sorting domain-containing protein [Tenacibaculum sp. M341]